MNEQTTTGSGSGAPTPAPETKAVEQSDEPKRYAVYDLTHLKFVGPVLDKRPSKAAIKDSHGTAHEFEVREV